MRKRGRSEQVTQGATPVAQYVRMSTDHQRYSTENQSEALQEYAEHHGMAIVRTYADTGKSGLNLEGRDALKQLIHDVQSGDADFEAILVYDISRWGRFQDADESGYYEYLCRRAGIPVLYSAEPFLDDSSPMTVVIKSVKRAMAAEYSRELSNKVFRGQCRLVALGFRQGGPAGFGLRRILLDENRVPKGVLQSGDRKSLQTDRVVLAPGPADELATVREIYSQFVLGQCSEQQIADALNAAGTCRDGGRVWTRGTVHQVLINEKYIGHNVYNRTCGKLKQPRVRNRPEAWVRVVGAFEAVVPDTVFAQAAQRIADRSGQLDDAAMLEKLKSLYACRGTLSGLLIDEQDDMPSSSAYQARFGGLVRAYSLVGFQPLRDYRYLEINRHLRACAPDFVAAIVAGLRAAGGHVDQDPHTDLLTINGEFTVSVTLARCLQTSAGAFRWRLRFDTSLRPDVTVAVRMAADQSHALDYYLFPHIDTPDHPLRVSEVRNDLCWDAYRFDSLEPLYLLAERVAFSLAA